MNVKHQFSKKLVLAAALGLVALAPMHALATQKLIVKDSGGSTNKFVITDDGSGLSAPDSGYVGIGTASPSSAIHAIGVPTPRAAQLMLQHNPTAGTAAGGGGALLYYNNNGTLPSPGDRLGYIYFGSFSGTAQRNAAGLRAIADGTWTSTAMPSAFLLETTPEGSLVRTERIRITNSGNVGIGSSAPTSILQVVGLPVYANNAAAIAGGLTAGAFYRTGADPDPVCVVH